MIRLSLEPAYDADVLVVGAGPAGASTAAHLASSGVRVLLVDRQVFPRDKVCGDFVGPAALLELEMLGLGTDPAIQDGNIVREAALYVDGRELIRNPIPEIAGLPTHGRVIPRVVLDDVIRGAAVSAGATVIDGTAVSEYETTSNAVRVRLRGQNGDRDVVVQALVGADGSSSAIARSLRGHATQRADRIIAVRAYYSGIEGPADQNDLYFSGDSFPGYCWLFPTSSTSANVGVGVLLDTLPPTDEHIRELLLRLVKSDSALSSRIGSAHLDGKIVGWPLTTFNPRERLVGNRVLLVGDAAGLINPLNGEGIQYALSSGRWAAESLTNALRAGVPSEDALRPYEQRVHSELRYDMALARLIIQLISNRTLNPVWLRSLEIVTAKARHDPNYARITGGVLAGLVPAREVLRPAIVAGTLQQAAKDLGVDAAFSIVGGPASLRRAGEKRIRWLADMSVEAARHPVETARWSVGVLGAMGELGIQATRDLTTSLGRGTNEPGTH